MGPAYRHFYREPLYITTIESREWQEAAAIARLGEPNTPLS